MKKVLVPRVRFKGFSEEWSEEVLGKIIKSAYIGISSKILITGKYEVIQQGIISIAGYTNEQPFENYEKIVLFGDHSLSVYKPKKPFLLASDGIKAYFIENTYGDYFYYLLGNNLPENEGYKRYSLILKEKNIGITYNKSEQQKIGKLLDQISNLINLENSKLNKLKQLKETLLQKMFPDGNSKTPRIRFKEFEGEWKEEKLENIYSFASEGGTPDTNKDIYYKPGLFCFTKIEDMANKYIYHTKSKISELGLKNSSAWIIPKNNILFSNGATIGNVSINKVVLSTKQGIVGMIIKKKFNLEFIYYLLKSETFQSKVAEKITVGTIPTVAIFNLKKIELFLTTNSIEQQKIGDFFSKIDSFITLYNSKLNKLKQIKEALLQKMFV